MDRSQTRRSFLAALPLVAVAMPRVVGAQAGKVWHIGFLSVQTAAVFQLQLNAFRQQLRNLGYLEGRNLAIEYRWAEGKYERLRVLARELAQLNVDVIVAPTVFPPRLPPKRRLRPSR